jgi:hypothetical protein
VLTNPAPPPTNVEPEHLEPGTFVFVGRLTRQKALGVAIAAIADVPDAQLVIVGDGPERAELERLAAASGGASRVRFLGLRTRDETLRIVAGAEAGLLSSDWENLPHSAVEALSVGVPVLSTAVGGVPEVVTDGENGLLVPPGDPNAVAAAVRRILEELVPRPVGRGSQTVRRGAVHDVVYGKLRRSWRGPRGDPATCALRRPRATARHLTQAAKSGMQSTAADYRFWEPPRRRADSRPTAPASRRCVRATPVRCFTRCFRSAYGASWL